MQLAKVIGTTVATAKDPQLTGNSLLLCVGCGADGEELAGQTPYVAVDTVGAGVGEVVLVAMGSAARVAVATASVPTDAAIVGIVDSVERGGRQTYRKGR